MGRREEREDSLRGVMEMKGSEIVTLLFIAGLLLKMLFS